MPRIIKSSKLGEAAILKQIINILEQEKIKTTENEKKETKLAGELKKEEPKKETSKITTKNEELKKKKK